MPHLFPDLARTIAVAKDDTRLRDALQAALRAAIADGSYDRVLQRWGLSDAALHTAAINAGT